MTKSPKRATNEQKHLRKCMIAFFEFYNRVLQKADPSYLNPSFLKSDMIKLFEMICKNEFSFKSDDDSNVTGKFTSEQYKPFILKEDYNKGHVEKGVECHHFGIDIHVSVNELRELRSIIDLLITDLNSQQVVHFLLENELINYEFSFDLSNKRQIVDRKRINKYKKMVTKAARFYNRRCSYISGEYVVICSPFRFFKVSPLTQFTESILSIKSTLKQIDDGFYTPTNHVPSIGTIDNYTKLSLMDLFKSLFVNYHVEFGSFKNIKSCKLDECSNVSVEIQDEKKEFCSPECRSKYSSVSEDPIRRKCRNRQNRYLRRFIDNYYSNENPISGMSVFKADCCKCELPDVKSGQCLTLLDKNSYLNQKCQCCKC